MRVGGGGGRAAARIRVDVGLVPGGSDRLKRQVEFLLEIDRLKTILHNYVTEGEVWLRNGIRREQVLARMRPLSEGAPVLWEYVKTLIEDAVAKGYLKE